MNSLKFKVGDLVRVRAFHSMCTTKGNSWDPVGKVLIFASGVIFPKAMEEWCGKVLRITAAGVGSYNVIPAAANCWMWTDEMLEDRYSSVLPASEAVLPTSEAAAIYKIKKQIKQEIYGKANERRDRKILRKIQRERIAS